jgi:hypothetical protein
VEFFRLGDPVVIGVDPEAKLEEDGIVVVDYAVAISAVLRLIKLSEGEKAVWLLAVGLRSEVAEELLSVVNRAVSVPIES